MSADPARAELAPGTTATASIRVGPADLASAVRGEPTAGVVDEFPAVLATARMIGLMEVAASRAMGPLLAPGELSVGVTVDVAHLAPTPPGVEVTATARYTGRDGKLYVFEVSAADPGGEIGRGSHKRAIVTTARLVAGAARRAP
jgi:fluoroacetyl-CoA thioesterase